MSPLQLLVATPRSLVTVGSCVKSSVYYHEENTNTVVWCVWVKYTDIIIDYDGLLLFPLFSVRVMCRCCLRTQKRDQLM